MLKAMYTMNQPVIWLKRGRAGKQFEYAIPALYAGTYMEQRPYDPPCKKIRLFVMEDSWKSKRVNPGAVRLPTDKELEDMASLINDPARPIWPEGEVTEENTPPGCSFVELKNGNAFYRRRG